MMILLRKKKRSWFTPAPVKGLLHYFFKSEHFVRTFATVLLVRVTVEFAKKLYGMETTFVDVKMDIPLFKIRRAGFPNFCIGV